MAISDGYTITASDLNSIYAVSLSSLQQSNATLPAIYWLNLSFNNIVAGTALVRRTRNIILPDDCFIAEIAIGAGEHSGTLTVTLDNGALVEAITISEAITSPGYDKATRYYSEDKPAQILLRGSELSVTVSTTDASATSSVHVAIGLCCEWRRY